MEVDRAPTAAATGESSSGAMAVDAAGGVEKPRVSEQKLTHEVAMPKVEAIDDLYSVTPHLKGQISEQQPHIIQELLAQIQANLADINENMSQALKRMKQSGERAWDCSTQTAASKPNPPTQEAIKVFDETPTYDVYDDEVSAYSNGFIDVFDTTLEQQQCEDENAMIQFEKIQNGDQLSRGTPDSEMLVMSFREASEKAVTEDVADFTFTNGPDLDIQRSIQLSIENSMIATSMSDSELHYTHRKGERLENVNCTNVLVTPQLKYELEDILLSGALIPEVMMDIPPSSTQRSYWLGHVLLKLPWDPGDINTRVKGMQMVAYNSIRLKSLEAFSEYYSEVFNRNLASNFTAEKSSDVVLHDPGIKRYADMYSWLEFFSEFEKPMQFTQGTVPLALQYQLTLSSVPRICDPGIELLLYKKDAQMQWDPGKDNKKFNYLIPVLCSPRFNAMHYCQIFQKCDAMSSHHYSQQDMNLCGIALWLITFNPP